MRAGQTGFGALPSSSAAFLAGKLDEFSSPLDAQGGRFTSAPRYLSCLFAIPTQNDLEELDSPSEIFPRCDLLGMPQALHVAEGLHMTA